jgi:nitroreductase
MKLIADVDEVLTTTRTVRFRLDFDRAVTRDLIEECLSIAQQSTMGSNVEEWRVVAVTQDELKLKIAELYRDTYEQLVARPLRENDQVVQERLAPALRGSAGDQKRQQKIMDGVKYLAENLENVPVIMVFATTTPAPPEPVGKLASGFYGTIFPMIWSFQLALRSRGLGSVMATGAMHHANEISKLLNFPDNFIPITIIPVAHTKGLNFNAAHRLPVKDILRFNTWGKGE